MLWTTLSVIACAAGTVMLVAGLIRMSGLNAHVRLDQDGESFGEELSPLPSPPTRSAPVAASTAEGTSGSTSPLSRQPAEIHAWDRIVADDLAEATRSMPPPPPSPPPPSPPPPPPLASPTAGTMSAPTPLVDSPLPHASASSADATADLLPPPPPSQTSSFSFVRVSRSRLVLDGETYTFLGINFWHAAWSAPSALPNQPHPPTISTRPDRSVRIVPFSSVCVDRRQTVD